VKIDNWGAFRGSSLLSALKHMLCGRSGMWDSGRKAENWGRAVGARRARVCAIIAMCMPATASSFATSSESDERT
jgi:hypothetical protein